MTCYGTRLQDHSPGELRAGIDTIVGNDASAFADSSILLLPDTHYPYHASTGMVTNPAVIRALVQRFRDSFDPAQLEIGIPANEFLDDERLTRYLGYERIAAEERVRLRYLDRAETTAVRFSTGTSRMTVDVPDPVMTRTVVNVPTARRSATLGLESELVNLAQVLTGSPDVATIRAMERACLPAMTVLDGTVVYAGEPVKTSVLVMSETAREVSALAADLFGLDHSAVPHLPSVDRGRYDVSGIDVNALTESMPSTEPPPENAELIPRGYRLYSAIANDLVPPQFLEEGP